MSKAKETERAEAIEVLRKHLRPGDTVHTIVRHASRSGMWRSISAIVETSDGPWDASGFVARAIDAKFDRKNGGVKMGGCGMDMGFALVYNLSRVMWPEGHRCAGKRCGSNEHFNPPYPKRDGRSKHKDGGYALHQRWL